MSRKKAKLQVVAERSPAATIAKKPAPAQKRGAKSSAASSGSQPEVVSGRWLLLALGGVLLAAVVCTWGSLCLLFWQGGWQLLYHPSSAVTRTPAAAGLAFDPIGFATTGVGLPQLSGWWIPTAPGARFQRYTVLSLHGQDGNLSNSTDHLARLHAAGVNVFAFDYRGYGRSRFTHPSEQSWLQDAGWALDYLTETRHIAPAAIVLDGSDLGANLALEVAAAHPELAGVILESPLEDAASAIFNDPRARLVPARLLVRDRYNLHAAGADLRIPSLWFVPSSSGGRPSREPSAYQAITARKMLVWLPSGQETAPDVSNELSRWLDGLPSR